MAIITMKMLQHRSCFSRVLARLLVLFISSAMLVNSAKRNKPSRALKFYLAHQTALRTDNLVLQRLSLAGRQKKIEPVLGRIDQILAQPMEIDVIENNEDIHQIELFHGSRRHLKMGSMGRKGRSRKRRYRGEGKKGMMSKGMKGMGKSKREKSEKNSGKGGGKGNLKDICADLDFSAFYGIDSSSSATSVFGGSYGKGKSGKGKSWRSRSLQFDGELCSPNALEVARMDPELSIFVDLVEAVNLSDIFLCAGPFTILAPSNAAFNENPDLLTALFNPRNAEVVQELLLYHIVPGLFLTDDLVEGPLQTLLGDDVDVTLDPLMFNQAGVTDKDILACNSVIDVIDDLLIPPDSPVLPEVCEILDFRVDGQFPTQSRFASIFNRRLGNGSGRSLQFRGERCQTNNVLETARQRPELSILVGLLEAAELDDLFFCAGPFTLLAPVNEAFDALDDDLVRQLLRPERKQVLQEILLYHLLPNYQVSSSFQAGPTETLLVDALVQVGTNPVEFNRAGVVTADIDACNGVIHTIDTVLLPNSNTCDRFNLDRRRLQDADDTADSCDQTLLDVARERPELSTVVALIEAAGLEDLFDCGDFTGLLPNNDAFDQLDSDYVDFLMDPNNSDELEDLLLYHFLPQPILSNEFSPGQEQTLLSDESVDVRVLPLRFDESGVVTPNIVACANIIHVIDSVLTPFPLPTPRPSPAPTQAPTPPDICDEFTFNRRVRHLQDGGKNCVSNVLDTARGNSDLSIATTLIDLAGLTEIFSCPGPFTALIPSNTVFDDVPQEFLDELVLPQNIDRLRDLLLYHILPGATQTTEFTAGEADTLLDGNQVTVTLNPLEFDGRGVLSGNIQACNGIVHIIGGLLNPFPTLAPSLSPSAMPNLAPVTDSPTLAPVTETPTEVPGPTLVPAIRLRIRDFYVSFVSEGARQPTEEENMEMLKRVEDHFVTYFQDFYSNDPNVEFIGASSSIDQTLFEAGIPEPRYNLYINFDFTEMAFSLDSDPPTTEELFELMRTSISSQFILDSVRTFTGSPFAGTTEAWFAAVEMDVDP